MANMGWNSAMNTRETIAWLTDKDANGEYRIPRIIYSDAYASETVAMPTWCCRTPPTSTLRRDQPAGSPDQRCGCRQRRDPPPGVRPGDATRHADGRPRDVRGFQSVLIELGARLGLPGLVHTDGSPKYRDYADYIVRHERAPGVGLLAGWRGGTARGKAARRIPSSCSVTSNTAASGMRRCPNRAATSRWPIALQWASASASCPTTGRSCCSCIRRPAEIPPAAQGMVRTSRRRNITERVASTSIRCRSGTSRSSTTRPREAFPLNAVTQRPMFMYPRGASRTRGCGRSPRATGSTCIRTPARATASPTGLDRGRLAPRHDHRAGEVRRQRAAGHGLDLERDRQAQGAWRLAKDAPEGRQGFLLNHLISDDPEGRLRQRRPGDRQAAWFDLRVSGSARSRPATRARRSSRRWGSTKRTTVPLRYAGFAHGARQAADDRAAAAEEEARPGDRPRHLRRLPCLRDQLQGMERGRHRRPADRRAPVRRVAAGRLVQPR